MFVFTFIYIVDILYGNNQNRTIAYPSCRHTLIGIILQFKNIHAAIYINKHNKNQAINIKMHGTWRIISKYKAHTYNTNTEKMVTSNLSYANERVIASDIDFLLQFVKYTHLQKYNMLY